MLWLARRPPSPLASPRLTPASPPCSLAYTRAHPVLQQPCSALSACALPPSHAHPAQRPSPPPCAPSPPRRPSPPRSPSRSTAYPSPSNRARHSSRHAKRPVRPRLPSPLVNPPSLRPSPSLAPHRRPCNPLTSLTLLPAQVPPSPDSATTTGESHLPLPRLRDRGPRWSGTTRPAPCGIFSAPGNLLDWTPSLTLRST